MTRRLLSLAVALLAPLAVLVAQRGEPSRQVEWPYYGGDQGGMKYSSLADINAANVDRLQKVWEWKHWETPLDESGTIPGFFEATPLMIDGVLYVTTPYNTYGPARPAASSSRAGNVRQAGLPRPSVLPRSSGWSLWPAVSDLQIPHDDSGRGEIGRLLHGR